MAIMQIDQSADGTIVKLNVNTVGGVISPGQQVLELLPAGVDLVVDARLQLTDIDAVKVGQPANVRLTALNQRTTPVVPAQVTFVSADKLTENAQTLLQAVVRAKPSAAKGKYIRSVTICSTMGPGVPLDEAPYNAKVV